ncbi:MAG: hypothetical protein WCA85_08585 [Paraburkholderia sp.]|uniref:hypothetical protein n=1 Tax=Paraburkholderia sp. TaxID=1926495 RepID=UPI003C31BD1C
MMDYHLKHKSIYRRFAIGYLGILGMVLVALGFSTAQGAGWKPVLIGVPVYLTFLVTVTYQFMRERRALKNEEREETSEDEK